MAGCFIGIGVGPGDPKLLTVRAVECIQEADVIIAPRSEKKEDSRALFIAQSYIKAETQIIKMVFPMVNSSEVQQEAWKENRKVLRELMEQGKKVVFLTLGDPTVYSTYIYVHKRVEQLGYATEIVSGITSFCAVSARFNEGLVEKSQQLHVIPASYQIEEALKLPGTKVLMKTGKKMQEVKAQIKASGNKAEMIENCGMPDEKIYRSVEEIPDDAGYYSLIIVKEK